MKRFWLFMLIFAVPGLLVMAQDETDVVHVVQPGETLFRIAQQYGLTTDALATENNLTDPTRIFSGQSLRIPDSAPPTPPQATNPDSDNGDVEVIIVPNGAEALPAQPSIAPVETETQYHTVVRGETLRQIAAQYGTTQAELIASNNLTNPNRILAGQQLVVGESPVVTTVDPMTPVMTSANNDDEAAINATDAEVIIHTVQAGEYVSSIARRYGVDANLLLAANNLTNPDRVLVGQELIIPNGADITAAVAQLYPEPGPVVNEGREIVIDLSNSRIYAYEDGILRYEAVSSNGLPATPTVRGNFQVISKVRSQTMSGPGYWLPNVEWVLYFYQAYAIHGAYWHNNFGQPMSHGCVNLTNEDARWFYEFAEIGTPVTVQY